MTNKPTKKNKLVCWDRFEDQNDIHTGCVVTVMCDIIYVLGVTGVGRDGCLAFDSFHK